MWCPRQESNLYHSLRRGEFYPLNYGGQLWIVMVSQRRLTVCAGAESTAR